MRGQRAASRVARGWHLLVVPAEEGVAAAGFDAVLDGGPGSRWVPGGPSVWAAARTPGTAAPGTRFK